MTHTEDRYETFYVVDFDRTLADSDKLTEVFIEIAEQYDAISREQVLKADADMKRLGDSLDTASYVRDHLNETGKIGLWEALEKRFIHESRSLNMLLPGAAELLTWLDTNSVQYGILTYGNPLWQRLKLTASGFNHVRRIITEKQEKGKLISRWRQSDGSFRLPHEYGGGTVERIVLIDDKARSFVDFPEPPSKGYWVLDKDRALPSQRGEVPEHVDHVSSLEKLLHSL